MTSKIKGIFDKYKNNKTVKTIVVILLIVCLIFITFGGIFNKKTSNTISENDNISEYVEKTENKLKNILSKIDGAGEVFVAITVEGGMETVIATKKITTETSKGKEIEESPILVNGKTVTLKEKYPLITGVLIVAEGAKNFSVLRKIQQATISLLDVNINNVEIVTMK